MRVRTPKNALLLTLSLVGLLLLGFGVVRAWLPKENPLVLARDVLTRMSDPADAEACRASFTTTTTTIVDDQPVVTTVDVEYAASEHRLQWVSDYIEIHADTNVAVVVAANEHVVYLHPSSPEELRRQRSTMATQMQDSLLSRGEIVTFTDWKGDDAEEADRLLVVRPGDRLRKLTMVDTVTFYIDSEAKLLKKAVLDYVPEVSVESVMLEYHSMEFLDSIEEFDTPILASVLDANGELLPRFSGYRLVDLRDLSRR